MKERATTAAEQAVAEKAAAEELVETKTALK